MDIVRHWECETYSYWASLRENLKNVYRIFNSPVYLPNLALEIFHSNIICQSCLVRYTNLVLYPFCLMANFWLVQYFAFERKRTQVKTYMYNKNIHRWKRTQPKHMQPNKIFWWFVCMYLFYQTEWMVSREALLLS